MKLLKQLIQVLDENGIQVNKLNIVEKNKTGFSEIEVNEDMTIEDRRGSYALYINEGKLSPTNYYSLTEALEVLASYLNRVKEGTILKSGNGKYTYRVIKHQVHDKYNLLNLETDRLLFLEHASLELIQAQVREGVFCAKETASTDEAEEEDAPMGYTFWYIDGTQGRNHNVLKATLDGDFEDSTGTVYTYQAVHGLIKPLDREDAREKFEEAKHYECLLKYYSTVDEFTMSKY
ncbi:hypothetical protein CF7_0121 [Staphylococcus phage CF7]|nr:hypothetical protein CF7_0121 [Staphylococcus phage CF7]